LLAEGRSFEDIARIRERRLNTVIPLVADLVERVAWNSMKTGCPPNGASKSRRPSRGWVPIE
jgi:hypothetical protein